LYCPIFRTMKEKELILNSDLSAKMGYYLSDAIERHPDYAKTPKEAMCIILEEIGELAQSINDGNREGAKVELFHCLATLCRLYGMFLQDDILIENTKKILNKEIKCCG
jgi:hypothetical protein